MRRHRRGQGHKGTQGGVRGCLAGQESVLDRTQRGGRKAGTNSRFGRRLELFIHQALRLVRVRGQGGRKYVRMEGDKGRPGCQRATEML